MNIGWILLTILMIGILVAVHEAGHFLVAKAFRFPIFEFSIGMGPALFKKKKNGTQYSLRLLPVGGYVAFESMDDQVAEERAFQKQALGHRFWVVLAGPLMNILIAIVIATLVLSCWGVAVNIPRVEAVNAESPAEAAGLASGDDVIAVNGVSIEGDYEAFSNALAENAGNTMTFTVRRGEKTFDTQVTPAYYEDEGRYMIGITVGYEYRPVPLFSAIAQAAAWTFSMVKEMLFFLGGLFRGKNAGDVSGIVGAVSMVAESGAQYGMSSFLTMVSYLSINLGVMNLLPLPALDGGKLLLMGVEKLRGKPLPPEKEGIMNMIALGLFMVLFIVLTFRDVGRIIGG